MTPAGGHTVNPPAPSATKVKHYAPQLVPTRPLDQLQPVRGSPNHHPPPHFRHFLPSQLGESEPRGTESNVSPQTVILERSCWRLALVHYKSPAITAELSTFPEWVSLWALRAEGGEGVGWGGRRRHLTPAVEREWGGGLVLYRQGRPSCSHSKAPLSTSPQ